ncbi:MAG: hypothetical protein WB867_06915 [Candidatus Dormiibacterota bacterium]
MDQASPPPWCCCLPTPDATTVSLSCPLEAGQPWLVGRALDILRQEAKAQSDPDGERYGAGRRQGAPLLLGEPLLWNRVPLVVEAVQLQGGATGEVTLRLPPWAELAVRIPEEQLWTVTDRLAAEFRASCGVVSDGRAVGYPDLSQPEATARRLQRLHLGVLIPPHWLTFLRTGSSAYRELPESQLLLVLE